MSKVFVRNKTNGTTYVYESTSYWDRDKKQSRSKRVCVGKLDAKGNIIPSRRLVAQEEPRVAKPGLDPAGHARRLYFGGTYLLDQIGKTLGIASDLKSCFPDTHKQILSIAYHMVLEGGSSMQRFGKWSVTHRHPYGADITSQRASELFQSITDEARNKFFALRAKRRLDSEYLAYDTSTFSSYSQCLKQVKYGKNKENDRLPQINFALVFGQESNLPYYYRTLAGNIPDVATLKALLADLSALGFDGPGLVLDRGFYSESNINALYRERRKFLLAANIRTAMVRQALDANLKTLDSHANYDANHKIYARTVLAEWDYTESHPCLGRDEKGKRRIYLHLYFNAEKAADDRLAFEEKITALKRELEGNRRVPDHEKQYQRYFEVSTTPARGTKVTAKEDALREARKYFGYFALVGNMKMGATRALETYRNRDLVEKAFGNMKERLNLRRLLVSSESSLGGKLFVGFVALIFLSHIKKVMQNKKLFAQNTMQELLDKADLIECFECQGRKLRVGEVLKNQKEIYEAFEIMPPADDCETSL